jgi:hypothetical protein
MGPTRSAFPNSHVTANYRFPRSVHAGHGNPKALLQGLREFPDAGNPGDCLDAKVIGLRL